MTKHEKLQEDYEQAWFALLMHKLAEEEGEQLLELNEVLSREPSRGISAETDQRCVKAIEQAFAKNHPYRSRRLKEM